MKRLLDTNAYVALKRGDEAAATLVRSSETLLVPLIVIGELLFGFYAGRRLARNLAELETLLESPYVTVPPFTRTTADRFGRIAAQLRRQGTPIPTNDIWIAAQAMEHGAEVVTTDRHFEKVPGLVVAALR